MTAVVVVAEYCIKDVKNKKNNFKMHFLYIFLILILCIFNLECHENIKGVLIKSFKLRNPS